MKFWDASGIIPLLVEEAQTDFVTALLTRDSDVVVWWGARVECVSALARLEREKRLDRERADFAYAQLAALTAMWVEVDASDDVRESAVRFLRVHALRAADALQLGAAFVASERRPPSLEFVTFDSRLAEVARREGFALAAPIAI